MYAFQQALRALRGNWIASVSTITTMTLSLTILAAFSLVSLNLNRFLDELQGELEVAAYLTVDANSELLLQEIRTWAEVQRVSLINPDDALSDLVTRFDYLEDTSQLIPNPLPPTLILQLADPAQTPFISQRLRQLPGVTDIEDGSDAVETFLAINDALTIGGAILIVVLLASALFAIVNSIRAAITARKEEIEVMRLVGATRGFIRAPFLIEGLLLGLMSALVALGLTIPTYGFAVSRLTDQLLFVPFVRDVGLVAQVASLLAALAVLVGLVGSAISVAQYLREDF
ncbi:MAG: permease-like cell division protein FtsX [Deinococcota bacterium]